MIIYERRRYRSGMKPILFVWDVEARHLRPKFDGRQYHFRQSEEIEYRNSVFDVPSPPREISPRFNDSHLPHILSSHGNALE